ncbi:MAG: hypothetical protein LBG30_05825 [Odoribacteraceae bacterium]|jgi:amino acid transporter|nr:hypothetical protein [Odoribacteraceae bacterium]
MNNEDPEIDRILRRDIALYDACIRVSVGEIIVTLACAVTALCGWVILLLTCLGVLLALAVTYAILSARISGLTRLIIKGRGFLPHKQNRS